jgi:hypothetical protein
MIFWGRTVAVVLFDAASRRALFFDNGVCR